MSDIASLSGIYQITNTVNGKRYIGSAAHLHRRWKEHLSGLQNNRHGNKHLQSSWKKHGKDAFAFIVLEVCEQAELIEREQAAIDRLKPEFNICLMAGSTLGRRHSAEARRKMAAAKKGRKHSAEHKAKIAATLRANPRVSPLLGKRQSEETVAKRAASLKRAFSRPETKRLLSRRRKEQWADPDFKEKTSKALRSALNRPAVRARLSEVKKKQWSDSAIRIKWERAINARWARDEFKAKTTAAIRAARSTSEAKAKTSAASKANWANPEYRANHSAAVKANWALRRAAKEQQNTAEA